MFAWSQSCLVEINSVVSGIRRRGKKASQELTRLLHIAFRLATSVACRQMSVTFGCRNVLQVSFRRENARIQTCTSICLLRVLIHVLLHLTTRLDGRKRRGENSPWFVISNFHPLQITTTRGCSSAIAARLFWLICFRNAPLAWLQWNVPFPPLRRLERRRDNVR